MKKPDVANILKDVKLVASKHSPQILTGIGIAGMITATILAVKATPKAMQLIQEEQYDLDVEELTVMETVKAAWKPYIPAIVTGTVSIACLIGANSVSTRRTAALATAYKLSETAFSEYKDKVVETIGENKEQAVKDKVAKSNIEKAPVTKREVIITPSGNTLCFDVISGRYFKSDIETIKKAVNELNRRMLLDMYISLSEFYDEIGLEHIALSDELGWNIDDGLMEIDFSSQLADDGTPCVVIDYHLAPKYDFNKLM